MSDVQLAFLLTILAGLSTGIGSLIAFLVKEKSTKFLTFSMGFAGGVMLYVSFIEIFPEATEHLVTFCGDEDQGNWLSLFAFFSGMFIVWGIDRALPKKLPVQTAGDQKQLKKDLMRVGVLTAIALAIHNFPEGVATFVAALEDPKLGISIAFAIALHNIPEGIAVSMPIYHATGNRKKAFMYSFLSGIVEPLGAFVGYLFLIPYMGDGTMGLLLSGVAGMMIFISIDQLLPAAEEYGEHKMSMYGVLLGMLIMAVSMNMLHVGHAH